MFIRSERLFLRPAWAEDAQDLYLLMQDRSLVRNLASAPWPYTHAHAQEFIAMPHERLVPRFLVTLPGAQGTRIIGTIGLIKAHGTTELGYWITRNERNRGYATEAINAVLRLAATLGHDEIRACHFLDNPASGRVLEKAGFQRSGRIIERYSQGRGLAFPAREYVLDFDEMLVVHGDDSDGSGRRAA